MAIAIKGTLKRFSAAVYLCIAAVVLTGCPKPQEDPAFCHGLRINKMIFTVAEVNSPDKDTQAIKPDAEVLKRNIQNHYAGGGPSSPLNDASYQRFRAFVKKKCPEQPDLEPTFPEAMQKDQERNQKWPR